MRFVIIVISLGALLVSQKTHAQSFSLSVYRHVFIGINAQKDTVYCDTEIDMGGTTVPDTAAAAKINDFMMAELIGQTAIETAASLEEAYVSFESECRASIADGLSSSWYYLAGVDELSSDDEMVTMEFYNESYTGGAHGLHSMSLYNFDARTGEVMELTEWMADTLGFKRLAEQSFWEEIASRGDTSTWGRDIYFWGNAFYFPENIGMGEDALMLLYNEYEAAPYAVGPILVAIPLEKARPYLKERFRRSKN